MPKKPKQYNPGRLKPLNPKPLKSHKLTTTQRGLGYGWQKTRIKKLAQEPLCEICLKDNRTSPASEVDHITPRHKGGTSAWSNLQSICKECHKAKTKEEMRRRWKERNKS